MSVQAYAVLAVAVGRAVIGAAHAAVLRAFGGRHKSVDTTAARPTIDDLAERVQAARVLARVHATVLVADGVQRAVLRAGAVALRLAAVHVRVAHVAGRASAHRLVVRPGDAQRRRMTAVRSTGLHGDALHVRHRIRSQSGRALADRTVIVRDADRVHAARVFVAGIITSVCKPVAELGGRAIDIVDAGHFTTAGGDVVWIAGVMARRALAVRHVIVDDA